MVYRYLNKTPLVFIGVDLVLRMINYNGGEYIVAIYYHDYSHEKVCSCALENTRE